MLNPKMTNKVEENSEIHITFIGDECIQFRE